MRVTKRRRKSETWRERTKVNERMRVIEQETAEERNAEREK